MRCREWRLRLTLLLLASCFAGSQRALAQGFPPAEAAGRMTLPAGFSIKLVAAEPIVRQPVAIDFDSRGRLWVIQYLQYPNPADLNRVKVDRYSRTVYDRVPEPPPLGPRGADRLTILVDDDGDGVAETTHDFLTGLNLASGFAIGHGGVYVLQAPFLLYYPDRDRDDVPDSDPEVRLSGFGMEDASAVANSLTWGPDGWLYGCQGSTVTSHIGEIIFQQGIWRYHPVSRRFELFCDGGGNTWGLDFDEQGNLFYSTNHGGFVLLHGVQGGYYWKAFEKHGPLTNPFAYGYFDHAPHENFRGGHVTVGGIVYQGDSFPASYRGKYVAADLLGHAVYWHTIEPHGSTFRTAHGDELALANDTWFAPTDVTTGPDGSIYVSDFHDQRTAHPDPDARWDRSNGRIFKIEAAGTRPHDERDLADLSSRQLVGLLSHPNAWHIRTARRLLAERRDKSVVPELKRLVRESPDDKLALEALWALYVCGGLDDRIARLALAHRAPAVRSWAVRLLADECRISDEIGSQLAEFARTEPDVRVRCQLAASARRLPPAQALPIIEQLLVRDEDATDPYVPLLLWWAVERHALAAREPVVNLAISSSKRRLVGTTILPRLVRRYAAQGTDEGWQACERLLAATDSPAMRQRLVAALGEGLRERTNVVGGRHEPPGLPGGLVRQLNAMFDLATPEPALMRLLVWLRYRPACGRVLELALDNRQPAEIRSEMLHVLGEFGEPDCVAVLLKLCDDGQPELVQLAALDALARFDAEEISAGLLEAYARCSEIVRGRIRSVLFSRRMWAIAFLAAIAQGQHAPGEVPIEQLLPLAAFHDEQIDALVRQHWGSIQPATPEEKLAEIRRLHNDLRAAHGDRGHGRELFKKHCGKCHRLFAEGEKIGPELTSANRGDRDFLLVSIVDPGALVRKEFQTLVVETTDGRVLTGLIAEASSSHVSVIGANNERTTIDRANIASLTESPISTMPDNLVKDLSPGELRDLFAYLQADVATK